MHKAVFVVALVVLQLTWLMAGRVECKKDPTAEGALGGSIEIREAKGVKASPTTATADIKLKGKQQKSTDERGAEVNGSKEGEELPSPEKFIGGSRERTRDDIVRERIIGMVFTGKPQPLDPSSSMSQEDFNRRRFRKRPFGFSSRDQQRLHHRAERPPEILKPLPFKPGGPPSVEFSSPPVQHIVSSTNRHSTGRRPPPSSFFDMRRTTPPQDPPPSPRRDSSADHSLSRDVFSNTVGPDFGPVTFDEDFGSTFFEENFPNHHHNDFHSGGDPHQKPIISEVKPIHGSSFGFTHTRLGGGVGFNNPGNQGVGFTPVESERDPHFGCRRYTADICLDTDEYPHEEILTSLAHDPSRARTLMAEVSNQSADNLVEGVSSDQESRYDFSHYFGNRRNDVLGRNAHRDFADDGGYLCPSEVKYARPKRARNSKGEWKFVVNMDKYTQTIRMEKCMKPGGSCSYVSHHYRATCNQVHNYQRLLSWEKSRGLHMDIFKVPSCCSCHIQGYSYVFPPLNGHRRKSGEKFSPSERIDKVLPVQEERLDLLNREAPPYSPVNFPNLPSTDEEQKGVRSRGLSRVIPPKRSPPRRRENWQRSEGGTSIKRSNDPEHRVNYDYHPIIDFFASKRSA